MLYIAKETSKTQPSTLAFKERGIPLTQARISDVVIHGKARSIQLAHSGYKDNIEAFLLATATGKKVTTEGSVYTLPDDLAPTVPLPFPQIIFKLAKTPTANQIRIMSEGLDAQGFQKVDIGKGDPSYTLKAPTFKTITKTLPGICHAQTAFIDNHAQLEAAVLSCRLYQCVDLFLATNTYYYKTEDYASTVGAPSASKGVGRLQEARCDAWYWRPGCDGDTHCHKVRKGDDGVAIRAVDDTEEMDLTPDRVGEINIQDVVHVAKPSPHKSSINFGPPSSVPYKSGLVFPYFPGLLVPDAAGLRVLSTMFIRNFGNHKDQLPKDAYVMFRKLIGTFANTPQGVLMTHVLQGVKLALDCQAVLFLLFDKGTYLGFVIIGEHFDIFMHGKWHAPLSARDLKAELATLRTHEQSLIDLELRLKKCQLVDGDIPVIPAGGIKSCKEIADILGNLKLDWPEKSPHYHDEKDISTILSRISFRNDPLTFKPQNIAMSIKYLCGLEPFPDDAFFHIPLSDWTCLQEKEYRILAQYGPRSFSLRNAKGDELLIPKEVKEKDVFKMKDDKGKYVYPKFIVGEKVLSQCLVDWRALVKSRSMRMDFAERAAGSRNHIFLREVFSPIWDALMDGVAEGKLGVKTGESSAEKRSHAVAFGSADFDESLF